MSNITEDQGIGAYVDDLAAIKWLFGILACIAIAILAAELL